MNMSPGALGPAPCCCHHQNGHFDLALELMAPGCGIPPSPAMPGTTPLYAASQRALGAPRLLYPSQGPRGGSRPTNMSSCGAVPEGGADPNVRWRMHFWFIAVQR